VGGMHGQVLKQAVLRLAEGNAWTKNVQPMTMIGDGNWSSIETSVEVLLLLEAPPPATATATATEAAVTPGRPLDATAAAAAYAGVCQRVTGGGGQISNTATQALCLSLFANGSWVLGSGPWNGTVPYMHDAINKTPFLLPFNLPTYQRRDRLPRQTRDTEKET
jgi:hypothetical protein